MKKLLPALALVLAACSNQQGSTSSADSSATAKTDPVISYSLPEKKEFNQTIDGKQVSLYFLKNEKLQLAVTNYGGRVVSLLVPGKDGKPVDVVVGPGTLQQFLDSKEPYYGAAIGRYGNRIAKGKFTLDGKTYTLATNNGPNSLHGGNKGFQNVVWDAKQLNDTTLELSYLSKDGEEGYPGNLKVKMIYTLTHNGLRFDYEATTDQATVCNLTNHAFFNLNGWAAGTINDHVLEVNALSYTPVDETLIPTGKIETVAGTPFDFTAPAAIGARVNDTANVQLKNGSGYDHNFVLLRKPGNSMQWAATITGNLSGISMTINTREPGLQFYGGNFMQGKNTVKGSGKDEYRTSFALETQHFPDSPNQAAFPSTVLRPGQTYRTSSEYTFTVKP